MTSESNLEVSLKCKLSTLLRKLGIREKRVPDCSWPERPSTSEPSNNTTGRLTYVELDPVLRLDPCSSEPDEVIVIESALWFI